VYVLTFLIIFGYNIFFPVNIGLALHDVEVEPGQVDNLETYIGVDGVDREAHELGNYL